MLCTAAGAPHISACVSAVRWQVGAWGGQVHSPAAWWWVQMSLQPAGLARECPGGPVPGRAGVGQMRSLWAEGFRARVAVGVVVLPLLGWCRSGQSSVCLILGYGVGSVQVLEMQRAPVEGGRVF